MSMAYLHKSSEMCESTYTESCVKEELPNSITQSYHFKDGLDSPIVIKWNFSEPHKEQKENPIKFKKELSPAEEIFESVKLFYKLKQKPITQSDFNGCMQLIKEEKIPKPEPVYQPPKPAYGSPEFWKAHWIKKKANGYVPKTKSKPVKG